MRRIERRTLGKTPIAELKRLTAAVGRAKKPTEEADRLWKGKSRAAFSEIQRVLGEMASGRGRCVYCEDSAGTDIEHFYPKGQYPQRAFRWDNYLWACSHCNSNRKRTQFPLHRGKPLLIDPTSIDPAQHLQLLPTTGEYRAIGPRGATSIQIFGLNDAEPPRKLPQARSAAFHKLQLLLEDYDVELRSRRPQKAAWIKQIIRDEPFSAVLDWLVAIAQGPATARKVLRPGIVQLVKKHDVASW